MTLVQTEAMASVAVVMAREMVTSVLLARWPLLLSWFSARWLYYLSICTGPAEARPA